MKHLDDLPIRGKTHDTQEAAESAFRKAIGENDLFIVQHEDLNDYGTDYQIEIRDGMAMTNIRVHVQLKGTESISKTNGRVSRKVARTNLNYLLAQPNSIYVCYHVPTKCLLVRYAEDVYREYEQKRRNWKRQESITVNFTQLFNKEFQYRLNKRLLAASKTLKQKRLQYAITPPDQMPALVQQATVLVEVPDDPEQAMEILSKLYEAGNDLVISHSFELFSAVLNSIPGAMDSAYMAEINLGVNHVQIDKERIEKGIVELTKTIERGGFYIGSILYCIGNGWLALGEYQKAIDVYKSALEHLDESHLFEVNAQCCKNTGAALEKLGNEKNAHQFYEQALEFNPNLSEAHFALALWHLRKDDDFFKALNHLDQVTGPKSDSVHFSSVQGWRIELLFKTGDITGAFREINGLLSMANKFGWIWPWCANNVANYGRVSIGAAEKAKRFWDAFLCEFPDDINAKKEHLLCSRYLNNGDG